MNTSSNSTYLPQSERAGLFNRGISFAVLGLLVLCLSIFIIAASPKITLLIAGFCILAGGMRLLDRAVWPLLAIVFYDLGLALFFPGPRPTVGLIFQHPLFTMDCLLLATLSLGGQSVRRQHILMIGILGVSLIGAIGDFTGRDMIYLLPIQTPDDGMFDQVTVIQGAARIRGFFAESGVLGAVSMGLSTILALGALVLIRVRVRMRYAFIAIMFAICAGGAIFCLTITKSGIFMIAAGLFGYTGTLIIVRDARCRMIALVGFAVLLIGGAAFMVAGPPSLTAYLRGEFTAAIHPDDMGASIASGHSGMVTRYKCWLLAFDSLRYYPFGVGPYGLGSVVEQVGESSMNHEMQFFFSRDIFGLKNALADLIAETGIVGIGLLAFWIWSAFIQPIRHYLSIGSGRAGIVAALYGASAVSSLVFLFSCELYPSFAFLLVLKFHADAIARACNAEPEPTPDNLQLIG